MAQYAYKAKKSLGQNFLKDANIAGKIVAALDIGPQDRVLEIGPGPGALTRIILQHKPAFFTVLEKDNNWSRELKSTLSGVEVIHGDGLQFVWEHLGSTEEPWKLIGNLPYNVASPIMWDVFSRVPRLERAVFMVQKEVALRLTAAPRSKAYGGLTVWVQSFVSPRLAFVVPPQVFHPRPKVDSAVVVFTRKTGAQTEFDGVALARTVKMCFSNRRKQLGKILKGYWSDELEALFDENGLTAQMRPEELTPEQFQTIAQHLKNRI